MRAVYIYICILRSNCLCSNTSSVFGIVNGVSVLMRWRIYLPIDKRLPSEVHGIDNMFLESSFEYIGWSLYNNKYHIHFAEFQYLTWLNVLIYNTHFDNRIEKLHSIQFNMTFFFREIFFFRGREKSAIYILLHSIE